jgi:tetratricopeptide (TPR) repeat protein
MSFMCRALALRVVACGVIGETARVGEWTSTLRARDAHALDALYAVMSEQGRGRTVFVAGDDRAGRSALLHDWLDGLAAMPVAPRVLGGVFEDGEYVPWERDRVVASDAVRALERLLSAGESAVSLLELGLPAAVTTLLGQVLAKSKEALELTHRALAAPSETSGAMLVPRALRRLCEDGPVVCVIETADLHAGGLWADLVERFARRVATNVALLLVLSLDGPAELGAHTDDEPAGLNVARQLTSTDIDVATWHWLAPLTEQELGRWTGGCAPEVLNSLLQITAGRGGFSVALWREWRASGVVEDLTDGRWRFSGGRDSLFDEVDDIVYERVQRLGLDLNTRERARRLLACAALEGRQFTAPAIAAARGWDIDDTIDLLDDVLIYDDEDSPDGFFIDTGFVAVADERGTRHLASYRFARDLDWMTLRHHGLSDAEQRHLAPRLAVAIQALYGGQAHRVATTLRRLFTLADDNDSAAYYRRMADNGLDRGVLLWRARMVLTAPAPVDAAERRRACRLLLAAANELLNVGPFDEGLAFANAAHGLSDRRADQARGQYLMGGHLSSLGELNETRRAFTASGRLYSDLGDRSGEADAREALAVIDGLQGDYERAQ